MHSSKSELADTALPSLPDHRSGLHQLHPTSNGRDLECYTTQEDLMGQRDEQEVRLMERRGRRALLELTFLLQRSIDSEDSRLSFANVRHRGNILFAETD